MKLRFVEDPDPIHFQTLYVGLLLALSVHTDLGIRGKLHDLREKFDKVSEPDMAAFPIAERIPRVASGPCTIDITEEEASLLRFVLVITPWEDCNAPRTLAALRWLTLSQFKTTGLVAV